MADVGADAALGPGTRDDALELRPPDRVMSLERLGSLHPTRLSFSRTLIRRMQRERWCIRCERMELDRRGLGRVVYSVHTPAGLLHFVAFSHDLPAEDRTDRVIATRWDATFALTAGPVDEAALARLARNVPLQEAGRVGPGEIVLSRANRSVRLFEEVVSRLAAGAQPGCERLLEVGYLMRTTAVYGNGKFGLGDLDRVKHGGVFSLPFQAEMLTVYLARHFSLDLVAHLARVRGGDDTATLDPSRARVLGVGNATGLGMAPFLITHPKLVDRWLRVREIALARVRARPRATAAQGERLVTLLARARHHVSQWHTDDERQHRRIDVLARELAALEQRVLAAGDGPLAGEFPFDRLFREFDRSLSLETGELLISLLLELNGDLVDDLENATGDDEREALDPRMRLDELLELVRARYDWALAMDFTRAGSEARFWYVSQEKDEPRLGDRGVDEGDELELRLDVARQVQALHRALLEVAERERARTSVAAWLLRAPSRRGIVRRVQSLSALDYAEIRANVLDAGCMPLDLLRCKLANFGAGKFDPKSDRWTRITLFQGAPLVQELDHPDADDWWMPAADLEAG